MTSSAPRSERARAGRRGSLRWLARSLIALAALLAAVVAAELWVRATDPFGASYYRETNRYVNESIALVPDETGAIGPESRIFENRPNAELVLREFVFRTDARGLRTGPTARAEGGTPILFLGDSVTLGWGVEDEHTWVRRLESSERAASGGPLRCLNAGHLMYNSLQEADWLEAHGEELAPAAVVVTFVSNDLDDTWAVYEELARAESELASLSGVDLALARLRGRLAVWFRGLHGLLHHRATEASPIPEEHVGLTRVEERPDYREAWGRVERGLDRILAWCRERGLPLVLLDHGRPPVAAVRGWCEANGVPWDDFAFTEAEWERDVRNSAADAHANELGNEILAEKARRALAAAGLIAER